MEKKKLGVRKGAWTKEEDTLLRNCIEKFGEGKWHKVPPRAGLNRCRKSCRLRWLNYLRPNIKRGYFAKDEIDLIQRLHKLIGNRWSLIAGRLPGRTANDVKNFWNTHILKKTPSSSSLPVKTEKNILVKPRPRTFSKSHVPVRSSEEDDKTKDENGGHDDKPSSSGIEFPLIEKVPFSLSEDEVDECIRWWLDGDERTPVSFSDKDDVDGAVMQPAFSPEQINEKIAEFSSIAIDGDIWDFTNFD